MLWGPSRPPGGARECRQVREVGKGTQICSVAEPAVPKTPDAWAVASLWADARVGLSALSPALWVTLACPLLHWATCSPPGHDLGQTQPRFRRPRESVWWGRVVIPEWLVGWVLSGGPSAPWWAGGEGSCSWASLLASLHYTKCPDLQVGFHLPLIPWIHSLHSQISQESGSFIHKQLLGWRKGWI